VIADQAKRSETPLSLVMIDLDDLKLVNDTHGHGVGDKMIKTVSKVFLGSTRKSDVVIRLGGDEFVLFLWNCNRGNSTKKMEKIQAKVEKKGYGFSFGVAVFDGESSPVEVMKEADEMMYRMKRLRKNLKVVGK